MSLYADHVREFKDRISATKTAQLELPDTYVIPDVQNIIREYAAPNDLTNIEAVSLYMEGGPEAFFNQLMPLSVDVPDNNIPYPKISKNDFEQLVNAAYENAAYKLFIDDMLDYSIHIMDKDPSFVNDKLEMASKYFVTGLIQLDIKRLWRPLIMNKACFSLLNENMARSYVTIYLTYMENVSDLINCVADSMNKRGATHDFIHKVITGLMANMSYSYADKNQIIVKDLLKRVIPSDSEQCRGKLAIVVNKPYPGSVLICRHAAIDAVEFYGKVLKSGSGYKYGIIVDLKEPILKDAFQAYEVDLSTFLRRITPYE